MKWDAFINQLKKSFRSVPSRYFPPNFGLFPSFSSRTGRGPGLVQSCIQSKYIVTLVLSCPFPSLSPILRKKKLRTPFHSPTNHQYIFEFVSFVCSVVSSCVKIGCGYLDSISEQQLTQHGQQLRNNCQYQTPSLYNRQTGYRLRSRRNLVFLLFCEGRIWFKLGVRS